MSTKGYLKVSESQSIYYERMGDFNKPSIIFLHGGPGLGFNDRDKELFDFSKCNVLFYDQRGSKRSKPKGSIEANTSDDLVQDLNLIIKHFHISKPLLVGGSWGSTLALLYSIAYPNQVRGMVLRGLFLADKESRSFFEQGGIKDQFPKIWSRFKSPFKDYSDEEVMSQYHKGILSNTSDARALSLALNLYGMSVNDPTLKVEAALEKIKDSNHLAKSTILSHYSQNDFFIPDNFIKNNLSQIEKTPIKIIHGKNDYITLIKFAREIAAQYEHIELMETNEGHSAYTEENKRRIREAISDMIL